MLSFANSLSNAISGLIHPSDYERIRLGKTPTTSSNDRNHSGAHGVSDDKRTQGMVDYYSGQGFYDSAQSGSGINTSLNLANNMNLDSLADAIINYGNSMANAQLSATNSANALNKEMWTLGEANTDRRLADQYAFNSEQAQLNRDFQAQQMQAVMDWESGLSNTAHQREVADLKSAGLNPVLSAGGQGASTPSVATPSGSSASGSAISGNHFQGHQANIVGAYSAAGQFISEYLGLLQNDAHFNREMDLQESNAKWQHALGIINAITGGLTSAVGLGISNKFANNSAYRADTSARDMLNRGNYYESKSNYYDTMSYYKRNYW